jgi:hypothetical protein
MGCETYALQDFRPVGCNNKDLIAGSTLDCEFVAQVKTRFRQFTLRKAD